MPTGKLPPVPNPPKSKNKASTHSKTPPASGQNGERSSSSSSFLRLVCFFFFAIVSVLYQLYKKSSINTIHCSKKHNFSQKCLLFVALSTYELVWTCIPLGRHCSLLR